jgi:ABC-type transporter Mla MlaB component
VTLRIENYTDGRKTVIRLSGRLQSTHLDELNTQLESAQSRIALDLSGVVLVDVEVVRFLTGCEESGGKTPVIQKSERWQANNIIGGEKVRGPFFNGPNQFAVHFTFDVTPKATGQRITLEEVGVYAVKDDKITREQCFYDGER